MVYLAITTGFLAFALCSITVALWIALRPNGLVETLVSRRAKGVDTMHEKLSYLTASSKEHANDLRLLDDAIAHKMTLLERQIKSLESKYGKASKKEERAELKRQILSGELTEGVIQPNLVSQ